MSEDERYVRSVLRSRFASYCEDDPVQFEMRKGIGYVRFGTQDLLEKDSNYFFMELASDSAYLFSFSLEKRLRGLGLSKDLLHAVDEIASEYNCPRIELTAVGDGMTFWPRMGFRAKDEWTLWRPTMKAFSYRVA